VPVDLLRALSIVLVAVFGWAAIAKGARWSAWRTALRGYQLPSPLGSLAAIATPLAEATVAVLLLTGHTLVGAAAALALLSAFSGIVLRARAARGDRLPCGCFGKVTSRDYRTLLLRNGALSIVAAVLLVGGEDVTVTKGVTFSRAAVVPAVLVVAGILLVVWMVAYAAPALRHKEQ
jgi:hypothetical protein